MLSIGKIYICLTNLMTIWTSKFHLFSSYT